MKVPSFQSLILKHLLSFSYLELFAGLFLPSDTWCASLNKTFSYCTHMFKHSSWHCKVHSLSLKPSLAFSEAITSTVLLSLPPWLRAPRLMHWLTKNTNSKVIEQETGIIYFFLMLWIKDSFSFLIAPVQQIILTIFRCFPELELRFA